MFTKSGAEQQLLQRAVDLKRSLVAALQKHRELQIDYKTRVRRVVSVSLFLFIVLADCSWQQDWTLSQSVVEAEERFSSKCSVLIMHLKITRQRTVFPLTCNNIYGRQMAAGIKQNALLYPGRLDVTATQSLVYGQLFFLSLKKDEEFQNKIPSPSVSVLLCCFGKGITNGFQIGVRL